MSSLQNAESLRLTDESLSEYLRSRYADRSFDDFSRSLHELVVELRNGRIRDRGMSRPQSNELVVELPNGRNGGFRTIGDLHKALERTKMAAELLEADYPPNDPLTRQYSAVCIVKVAISLLDNDFFISRPPVLDRCSHEKLEEYRRHILPEADEPQPMED